MNGVQHPSRMVLDLALIGSAPAEDAAHISGCARCRALLAGMERERDAFLSRHPRLPERAPPRRAGRARWLAAAALAASIAAAVLIARPGAQVRMKGGTTVDLWVKRGAETFAFDGRPLRAGDTLVFRYTTSRTHLTVIDAEASGKVSVVIDQPIEPGSARTAPSGVALDDYPGGERVIALFSDGPLDALRADPPAVDRLVLDADSRAWHIQRSAP